MDLVGTPFRSFEEVVQLNRNGLNHFDGDDHQLKSSPGSQWSASTGTPAYEAEASPEVWTPLQVQRWHPHRHLTLPEAWYMSDPVTWDRWQKFVECFHQRLSFSSGQCLSNGVLDSSSRCSLGYRCKTSHFGVGTTSGSTVSGAGVVPTTWLSGATIVFPITTNHKDLNHENDDLGAFELITLIPFSKMHFLFMEIWNNVFQIKKKMLISNEKSLFNSIQWYPIW